MPWSMIGIAYGGFTLYILLSLINPADEALSSLWDVALNRGKTILSGALATFALVLIMRDMGELNMASAFLAGYANVSMLRKGSETYMNASKIFGKGDPQ